MLQFLTRPVVVFDLETTGTDTSRDQIAEFMGLKLNPDGTTDTLSFYCKPDMPLSEGAKDVTGLTDEFLAENGKSFSVMALSIKSWLAGCDLAGYNIIKFDVPMLQNEFIRAGVDFDLEGVLLLDAYEIFCALVPRTLTGAVKFFLGQDMDQEQAHGAGYDVQMTAQVLAVQLQQHMIGRFPNMNSLQDVHKLCNPEPVVDIARKLTKNSTGEVCWNFGKHKGRPVHADPNYMQWFMSADFPMESKKQVQLAMEVWRKRVRDSTPASIPLN